MTSFFLNFPESLDRKVAELDRALARGELENDSDEYEKRKSGILEGFQEVYGREEMESGILEGFIEDGELGKAVSDLSDYEAARRGGFNYQERISRNALEEWMDAIQRYEDLRTEIKDMPVDLRGEI